MEELQKFRQTDVSRQTVNEEVLTHGGTSSVAQSKRLKPVSCVKLLFRSLSCKISNLSTSLWGKHSCSPCIILYKHLTILFELCSYTHYTSFEDWVSEHCYILVLAVIKCSTEANYIKTCVLLVNKTWPPSVVASRIQSRARKKEEDKGSQWATGERINKFNVNRRILLQMRQKKKELWVFLDEWRGSVPEWFLVKERATLCTVVVS